MLRSGSVRLFWNERRVCLITYQIPATCYHILRQSTKLTLRRLKPPQRHLALPTYWSTGTSHHSSDAYRHSTAFRRLSSSATPRPTEPQTSLTEAQRTAYTRLRPIIDKFEAPIDWAVAYGSGVVHQANATPGVRVSLLLVVF